MAPDSTGAARREAGVEGTVTVTTAGRVNVHTYVAPERGWRAASHLIELPGQTVLFDMPLALELAREVLDHAAAIGKPLTRCYISHAHPDHFAGTVIADVPTYALRSQKELIDRSGDLRIARAYLLTPGHEGTDPPLARPVDRVAEAGDEVIDGVRLSFQRVLDAETSEQLTIGLPEQGILLAQDVVYHDVHPFIGEQNFATWSLALDRLRSWPYHTVLPGHGLPGGRRLYGAAKAYLATAAAEFAAAAGPGDLNRRLEAAYPAFGGRAMQGLQNFYLYPAGR
jgi:glyoxylase-like metal-dependent hydrolase (beta-lactamase superfamily II)